MVLVRRHMENGATLFCGGFLLNEDFVMTAAHCHASTFTVWLGLQNINEIHENVQQIEVEQSFPHKKYNKTRFINDLMLLKLGSKAQLNQIVTPIRLAVKEDESLPGSCIVTGWGQISNEKEGEMSSELMEVDIKLIKDTKCEQENIYCSEGLDGPRQGDSGGPLVCEDNMAFGVVSAMLDSPGRILYKYTKIPDYMDWIVSITENSRN